MSYNTENGVLIERNSSEGLVKFRRRKRFDDDFRGLPPTQTRIEELRSIRFFTGKGDRIVTDIDRDIPQIGMFVREINLQPFHRIVDLNCMKGHVGIALARLYPNNQFLLIDNNLLNVDIASQNVEKNSITNATVQGAVGIEGIDEGVDIDSIVIETSNYMSYPFIEQQIAFSKEALPINNPLFLISHKKSGAERHQRFLQEYFGEENVEIIGRGKGGIRIFRAVKADEHLSLTPPSTQPVEFEVQGRTYSLESNVGLFSKEQLDEGTRLLLENVNHQNFQDMLDVGCGWGPIGIVAASSNPGGRVTMTDIDLRATTQAQANVVRFGLENQITIAPTIDVRTLGKNFDLVLSNPPFHQDYGTLVDLFGAVRDIMRKDGELYVVIEKSYVTKFKDVLQNTIGNSYEVTNNGKYWILHSKK